MQSFSVCPNTCSALVHGYIIKIIFGKLLRAISLFLPYVSTEETENAEDCMIFLPCTNKRNKLPAAICSYSHLHRGRLCRYGTQRLGPTYLQTHIYVTLLSANVRTSPQTQWELEVACQTLSIVIPTSSYRQTERWFSCLCFKAINNKIVCFPCFWTSLVMCL